MSVPSRPAELSPEARADYTSILLYTSQHWGERQMNVYNDLLEQALRTISANPDIGRPRDDLRPGLRSYQTRQHVIFYRIEETSILVRRILHVKMDAATQFNEP